MKKYSFSFLLLILLNVAYAQSPINLISLHDKDTIDYKYPVFNWYYVTDGGDRNGLVQYRFVLVKLLDEQSAEAGVTVNQPLMQINDVSGFQLVYPFDAPELEYGNRYGWRLQRLENGIVTGQSEAWEFILYKVVKLPMKYALLNTAYSATEYTVEEKGFFFKYNSRYQASGTLHYQVLNENREPVNANLGEDQKLGKDEELEETGSQFHFLNTESLPSGSYLLLVTDSKGNEFNTRFRIK